MRFGGDIAGGEQAVTFEDREDFDPHRGQAIDDAVIPFEDFSDCIRSQFRNLATGKGESRQSVASFQELGDKARGSVGRIRRDKIFDFLNTFQSLFRPNDFHVDFLASRQAASRR